MDFSVINFVVIIIIKFTLEIKQFHIIGGGV